MRAFSFRLAFEEWKCVRKLSVQDGTGVCSISPMSRDDLHTKRWSPSRVDLPVLPRESPSGKIQTRDFPPGREISETDNSKQKTVISHFFLEESPFEMEEEPNFELFLNEVQEPPAKQARFASVSASDVEEMLAKRVPENTKKATLKWVTVFNEYLAEKGIGFDFGTGGAEELSLNLSQTYPELRQKNGEPYSKSSLVGFRAAIQRHLRQLQDGLPSRQPASS